MANVKGVGRCRWPATAPCRATRAIAGALLALAVAACAGDPPPVAGGIFGMATYRERMALPPDAVFEAVLEDVSRADAPAVPVAGTRIVAPGPSPIRFVIAYDPERLAPDRRYAIRALIRVGDRLLFTTDRSESVLGAGQGNTVEIPLRRATPDETSAIGARAGGRGPSRAPADTQKSLQTLRGDV